MNVSGALVLGRYFVDRLLLERQRAEEVRDVRARLVAQAGPGRARRDELDAAGELRRLREAAARAFGVVKACTTCAVGRAAPHGVYPGGFCCGATTAELFTDEELAALRLTGTGPGDLRPAVGALAGCAFRGPRGCVLPPAHRPNQCLGHLCYELVRELQARGDLAPAEDFVEELRETFLRFAALRRARLDDELLGLR